MCITEMMRSFGLLIVIYSMVRSFFRWVVPTLSLGIKEFCAKHEGISTLLSCRFLAFVPMRLSKLRYRIKNKGKSGLLSRNRQILHEQIT